MNIVPVKFFEVVTKNGDAMIINVQQITWVDDAEREVMFGGTASVTLNETTFIALWELLTTQRIEPTSIPLKADPNLESRPV